MNTSFQQLRQGYRPRLPKSINVDAEKITITFGPPIREETNLSKAFIHSKETRPMRMVPGHNPNAGKKLVIGVLFSGGPAPGGHNVISGLFDAMMQANPQSQLYGYLNGPDGILKDEKILIDRKKVDAYRNTGGFDLMGSGRTKIDTADQFAAALKVCSHLNALVVIGGDDSNTNAALLAEYFLAQGSKTQVVGIPKTIDGDLQNEWIELSFGFDTASRVYSELIGNIARDAISSRKYWHFIKLMGRSASHIALECALRVRPNICIISEEVADKKRSLQDLVDDISDTVIQRARKGEKFGVVLLPEGLIEFIPQMRLLISQLNTLLAKNIAIGELPSHLGESAALFQSFPPIIREQLLMDRDPHGNVQVSRIDTETLIAAMVAEQVKKKAPDVSFSPLTHFFGYEGRAAYPSNFDADYCYSLGRLAFLMMVNSLTGCIAAIQGLHLPTESWQCAGLPIRSIVHLEERHGKMKPVIKKALVDLEGNAFSYFARHREEWKMDTHYHFPGAIQYFGPSELVDQRPHTLTCDTKK